MIVETNIYSFSRKSNRSKIYFPLYAFNYYRDYRVRFLRIFLRWKTRPTVHRSLINSTRVHAGDEIVLITFWLFNDNCPVPIQYVVKKILDICITGPPLPSSTSSLLPSSIAASLVTYSRRVRVRIWHDVKRGY